MRKRQAKKILRREAARLLAIAFGAETTGHVDPRECGVLTMHACVAVLRSEVATLRGLRSRVADDYPLPIEARLHGVPARLLFPELKFKRAWRGPKRSRFDVQGAVRATWRRRFLRPCAGELGVVVMPDGKRVSIRRHVARAEAIVDGLLDWVEHHESWTESRWRARRRRERRYGVTPRPALPGLSQEEASDA